MKTLKSNISKTVRDKEKMSKELIFEVKYGLSYGENMFDLMRPLKVKGHVQNPKSR